jgi:hypothetical protein
MARYLAKCLVPRVLIGGVLIAALVALFSLPGGTAHADGSFDTTVSYHFCNQLPSDFNGPAPLPADPNCSGNFSPGANPDFGFTYDVPSGDYMFSTFAVFMSDGFSIAADADIDDGTVVGGVRASVTLGLISNACNLGTSPDFILYDSTTDTSNTVDALPEGTQNRFSNLETDGGDAFPHQADANSPAVLKYPSFLNTLLDPDLDYTGGPNGPLPPISPHARYTGLSQVPAGGEWVFLSILVFEESQLAPFVSDPDNATHPFARYGRNPSETGWVYLVVLQDPMEVGGTVSTISDFCSPMIADAMFLGQVTDSTHGTVNRLTSPAANSGIDGEGTHLLLLYGMSLRDTDGDGLENSFDTCPFTANLEDPRITNGGAGPWGSGDHDMIDPACDPTPNQNSGSVPGDHDSDGFQNSQDNCPLVANATQVQGENTTTYVLAAPDAGFRSDSLGDACDSEGGGSDAVADGGYLHDMNTDAVCIGGVDASPADGFCDAGGMSASAIDTDGDTYANYKEVFMQTDPLVDCPIVIGSHDAWPPDFDANRTVNIVDIFKMVPPVFNSSPPNPNYHQRRDLNADGVINIVDIFKMTPPVFNSSCTP